MAAPNPTTKKIAQDGRPGSADAEAGSPAGSTPQTQAKAPDDMKGKVAAMQAEILGLREKLKEAEEEAGAVEVAVPDLDALLASGASVAEALAAVEAAVGKAVAYGKRMRELHGPKAPPGPTKEQTGPYRVTETKHNVAIAGGLTTIPAGTIVDLRSYGLVGIARLKEQGVKMVLVEQGAGAA